MALLNQLLAEEDLARLSNEQKDFLAQRIDFALDTSKEIHQILANKLERSISLLGEQKTKAGSVRRIDVLKGTGWSP
jgi:flagellar motor switch protein FliG